jgi:hypothetical protein
MASFKEEAVMGVPVVLAQLPDYRDLQEAQRYL